MLKHLKGARVMQDCSTGALFVDTGTGGQCKPMGASSWNDLKDKPFGVEMSEIDAVPATDALFVPFDDEPYAWSENHIANALLVEGQTYTVIWNGQIYECVAKVLPGDDYVYIGNDLIWWSDVGVDNGIPFAITVRWDGGIYVADFGTYSPSAETTVNVCVKTMGETVHTVDPKYLPCDLMFKVGCAGTNNPKDNPTGMTKPTIVSGSLEAVLEKLANGEIPVVKVQYMGIWNKNYTFPLAYGGEFTCDTKLYGTSVMFCHNIPSGTAKIDVQITMDIDDPSFMEMKYWAYNTKVSPLVIS